MTRCSLPAVQQGNLSPYLKNCLVTRKKEIIIIPSCVVLWWKTVAWWEKCQGQCNERPTVNSDLISEVSGGWGPGKQSRFCGLLENTFKVLDKNNSTLREFLVWKKLSLENILYVLWGSLILTKLPCLMLDPDLNTMAKSTNRKIVGLSVFHSLYCQTTASCNQDWLQTPN